MHTIDPVVLGANFLFPAFTQNSTVSTAIVAIFRGAQWHSSCIVPRGSSAGLDQALRGRAKSPMAPRFRRKYGGTANRHERGRRGRHRCDPRCARGEHIITWPPKVSTLSCMFCFVTAATSSPTKQKLASLATIATKIWLGGSNS